MADVSIIIERRIRCQTEFHRQMAVVWSDLNIRQGAHIIVDKRLCLSDIGQTVFCQDAICIVIDGVTMLL